MDISGKNVVFVGGLGGIGFKTCKELLKYKITNLAILDITENSYLIKELQDINGNCKVIFIAVDITQKASIKQAMTAIVAQFQYIDILVNGAGIVSDRNVELTININLIGLINTTLEAFQYMDKTQNGRGGMIVNVASVLGLEPCGPLANYCASKHGVIGFTRSIADPYYYNRTGVAVMAICPGITLTPIIHNLSEKDTFDFSKPLTQKFITAQTQNVEVCAQNFVKALLQGKNNNIWILGRGNLELVSPQVFWEM